ncbi:MAG: hypothetical protein AAGF07_02840 [Patescibacteria group bacterium]
MPIYKLAKVDISQILGQVNSRWSKLKIVGLFSNQSQSLLIESRTKLHNFNLQLANDNEASQIKKFKPRFSYTTKGKELSENNLASLVFCLANFNFASKVRLIIKITSGSQWKEKLLQSENLAKVPSATTSSYSLVDLLKSSRTGLKTNKRCTNRLLFNECFSVQIIAESETEEAFQFLASFRGKYNRVVPKGFWSSEKLLMTKDELASFLDLSKYAPVELEEIKDPILLGHTKLDTPIEFSKDRLHEHLKIEGKTRSGKSGAMISILTEVLNEGKRVLLVDPHNSTTQKVIDKVDSTDNIVQLYIENPKTQQFLGKNVLINFGPVRKREEYIEDLEFAFFSEESENRQLATIDVGRELLSAGVNFNYEYYNYLVKRGLADEQIVKIIREKQLTLNDLKRIPSDENLRQLMAEILRPNHPAMARKLADLKQFDQAGLRAAITRFSEAVQNKGRIFFESRGFNPITHLQQGKSVFCNLLELGSLSRNITNKLVFSKLIRLHFEKKIKYKTYFAVDEAASAKIPKLMQIVTESNMFDLHLILAYQSLGMWKDPNDKEALELIPNLIEFNTDKKPKKKREFTMTMNGHTSELGITKDYAKALRSTKLPQEGESYETVLQRIKIKEDNIYDYFMSNLECD